MRRFLLNIPNHKTAIELLYNSDGLLLRLNFNGLALSVEQVTWVKGRTPARVEDIEAAFSVKNIDVREADLEITFDDFMREYPLKKNTHLARKYWPKMSSPKQMQAFYGAVDYRAFLAKPINNYRSPMLPDKWLRDEMYLNNWKEAE